MVFYTGVDHESRQTLCAPSARFNRSSILNDVSRSQGCQVPKVPKLIEFAVWNHRSLKYGPKVAQSWLPKAPRFLIFCLSSTNSMGVFLTRLHSSSAPSPPLMSIWNASAGLSTHYFGIHSHPHAGSPFQTCSAISCSLSCRCAMSDFHMTLENHGRYLTVETTQLLESQVETCHAFFFLIVWLYIHHMFFLMHSQTVKQYHFYSWHSSGNMHASLHQAGSCCSSSR